MTAPSGRGAQTAQDWGPYRFAPLAALALIIGILAFALPSSLNLPQTNPTETAEYAPVPPSDETPPPIGNLSALGLAESSSIEDSGLLDEPIGNLPDLTQKPSAATYRCVGNPPRQTEDPLSPPCVGHYDGNNGGATYQGVTGEEIRVLWYIDGGGQYETSQGFEPAPVSKYEDMGKPPPPEGEFIYTRIIRGWQRYFNSRFQTYKRFVHFYIYWSGPDQTPEGRRADAAETYARIKPFAVLSQARNNQDAFLEAMAQRGVLNFGSVSGRDQSFFAKYPKLIWGYPPSIQQQARMFSTYLCTKVVGKPVQFSGNAADNGRPRVLGMLSTVDPARSGYRTFSRLVKREVEACGGRFAEDLTFPVAGSDNQAANPPQVAAQNIASFQSSNVTTIIWPQGQDTSHSKTAQSVGYLPEWVVAGDLVMEGALNGGQQGQAAWNRAFMVTTVTKLETSRQQQCFLAFKEAEPDAPDDPDVTLHACNLYRDPFQLFLGIQVAGPQLHPNSIDRGFRAIPKIASTDPKIPACYYDDGDYTCVKDVHVGWWDSSGQSSAPTPGCYRLVDDGRRYRAGTWDAGNVADRKRPGTDVCNNYLGDLHL
jgi:hypothetical protein